MPHRPPKRSSLHNKRRPKWCKDEPGYWLREKERLAAIAKIKASCNSFTELDAVCRGCDHKIWEARKDQFVYRGCHCVTFCVPLNHDMREFDLAQWSDTAINAATIYEAQYRSRQQTPDNGPN